MHDLDFPVVAIELQHVLGVRGVQTGDQVDGFCFRFDGLPLANVLSVPADADDGGDGWPVGAHVI